MKTTLTKTTALRYFGNRREPLAKALGCTPEAISMWGEYVPPNRAFELEVITGGGLKARNGRRKPIKRISR